MTKAMAMSSRRKSKSFTGLRRVDQLYSRSSMVSARTPNKEPEQPTEVRPSGA